MASQLGIPSVKIQCKASLLADPAKSAAWSKDTSYRASRKTKITSHIMYRDVVSFAHYTIWHSFTTVLHSLAQLCLCVHASCNKQFRELLFGRHRELLCDSAKSISILDSRSAATLQWAYQPNLWAVQLWPIQGDKTGLHAILNSCNTIFVFTVPIRFRV